MSTDGFPLFPLDRPTPVPDGLFREVYGGSMICTMIMLVLYGLSILQTYIYFFHYPNDAWGMKTLVTLIFFLSTAHAIFLCHTVYHYIVLSYHDPMLLIGGEWSVYGSTALGVVICFCVQVFYARMIYHLTKNRWRWVLTGTLIVLIMMQVAFGIVTVNGEFREWDLSKLANIALNSMVPMFAARVASDSVTALSLCILLHEARPGFGGSNRLVHTLIIYSVNRFLFVTVVVIVQMVALICKPDSIWAMIIDFVSAHLYVNSLLATLNSRNHLRDMSNNGGSGYMDTSLSGTTVPGIRFANSVQRGSHPPVNVAFSSDSAGGQTMSIELDEAGNKRKLDFDDPGRERKFGFSKNAVTSAV